ncbi:MAG: SAM-dependent methyltransferase [Actinobacteria bacterium]|nr:SAM-dependent methyltransferase [Actinomycetota bacterium]MBI3688432.1 SAM-dependent methyltransferase [Actinomycetota bacterium]
MSSDPANGGVTPEVDWSWTERDPGWVPPEIDQSKPSVARIYDYILGGKDNFAVDREAAEKAFVMFPDVRDVAVANRGFLVRAVRLMAEAGIRQYLDLGTGIPTSPNVHEVARQTHPDARVVYVDNDPMVMAHNRALRATSPGVATVHQDLRDPAGVLADPVVRDLIDFDEPVGLLLIGVMHFVPVDIGAAIVARYRKALVPGSYLVLSTQCVDGTVAGGIEHAESTLAPMLGPVVARSAAQIEELFEGFDLLEPGLVDVSRWRADGTPGTLAFLGGVGLKT